MNWVSETSGECDKWIMECKWTPRKRLRQVGQIESTSWVGLYGIVARDGFARWPLGGQHNSKVSEVETQCASRGC